MQEVVIVAATRTAIGSFQGSLASIPAPELGAAVILVGHDMGLMAQFANRIGVMIEELEGWLAEVTGYDAVSVQPNSGAQGELAGLLAFGEPVVAVVAAYTHEATLLAVAALLLFVVWFMFKRRKTPVQGASQ